ncbi:unnamed protein product [Microthlaspi erraticum]|uniref:Uncharacterized protein n=1 Tax=Microthlaspi erraticum TaxID=1685480 RepID=A0A6D2HLU4_9BRAS|nr:unnamed protein product [Microthlaspi erraticum]
MVSELSWSWNLLKHTNNEEKSAVRRREEMETENRREEEEEERKRKEEVVTRESTMNLRKRIHMSYHKRKAPIEMEEIRNLLKWQWRKRMWNHYGRRILKLDGEATC